MEANPESVTAEKAAIWHDAGVSRISLGVQSLDDGELRRIGRVHDAAGAEKAFGTLRDAGFRHIGLDLIWGLPGQTVSGWSATLERALRLSPEHLSCYGLSIEPESRFEKEYAAGRLHLPSENVQAEMYLVCCSMPESRGYRHYEISNFALPGFECRHNVGYWQGREYLGIGPGAVSRIGGMRFSGPADIAKWSLLVEKEKADGRLIAEERSPEILTEAIRREEFVMLSLRMASGLSRREFLRTFGSPCPLPDRIFLDEASKTGLLKDDGDVIRLTDRGMLVSNSVMERFLEML